MDCSSENKTTVETMVKDAIEITSLSLATIDLASARRTPERAEELLGPLTAQNATELVVRWFGEDVLLGDGDDVFENLDYIRGMSGMSMSEEGRELLTKQ